MSEPVSIEGGCFCRAVRYRATAAPWASMICHCTSCRRISGAPVMAWLTFPKAQFQYVQGAPSTLRSSPGVQREFCPACGTQLTYRKDKYLDEIDVATCSLDDPAAFPPGHHSWMSQNIEWVQFNDGRPTFQCSSSDG